MDTGEFLVRKRAIFRKIKEVKVLRGSVPRYAAQARLRIDAEIAEKGWFPDRNKLENPDRIARRVFAF
jgi:hypothetical protein